MYFPDDTDEVRVFMLTLGVRLLPVVYVVSISCEGNILFISRARLCLFMHEEAEENALLCSDLICILN